MTTHYIDYINGNDSNTGSKTSPWKRCPGMVGFSASYTHSAGDTFIFKGGVTWTSSTLPLTISYSGNSTNADTYTVDKTWYNGSSWTQPIFNMEQVKLYAITMDGKSYITLNNLRIINPADQVAYQDMVRIKEGVSITIQNCTIDGSGGAGSATPIEFQSIDGALIENNYICSKGAGDGNPDGILIRPWFDMKNIVIRNNEITTYGSGGDGIHIDLENDYYDTDRMFIGHYGPILIENNSFHDITGVKMGVILIGGARDLTIRYNKFYGVFGTGTGVRFGNANQGYDKDGTAGGPYHWWYENCQVYYNLFYQTCSTWTWGAMLSLYNTNPSLKNNNNIVYNNVFWANGSYPDNERGIYVDTDDGSGWKFKNNIIVGLQSGFRNGGSATIDNNIFYNNLYYNSAGTNFLIADPKFINPSTGNFHLQSNSPCIDTGIDWGQTRDFDGNPKQGSAWDIGAYEFLQTCPQPIASFIMNII